jgi:hypothetical protein
MAAPVDQSQAMSRPPHPPLQPWGAGRPKWQTEKHITNEQRWDGSYRGILWNNKKLRGGNFLIDCQTDTNFYRFITDEIGIAASVSDR